MARPGIAVSLHTFLVSQYSLKNDYFVEIAFGIVLQADAWVEALQAEYF